MNLFLVISLLFCDCYVNNTFLTKDLLTVLITSFNEHLEEKGLSIFKSTEIESARIIYDLNGIQYFYLDYQGSNGFMLIKEDNTIVLFNTSSDIPYLRTDGVVYYSDYNFVTPNGFLDWRGTNDRDVSIGVIAQQYDYAIEYGSISSYISSKYSAFPEFEIISSGKLNGLLSTVNSDGLCSFDESVYVKWEDNVCYSEQNCGIISLSNAISYYARYTSLLPVVSYDSYSFISPLTDEPEYAYYVANYGYYPKGDPVFIHGISDDVRINAIDVGYECLGMSDYQTEYAFEETISQYGYTGIFTTSDNNYSLFSLTSIKNEIDNNRPVQLRVSNDVLYNGHGMMITGYRYYMAEDWIPLPGLHNQYSIYVAYSLPFVSVYDGHSNNERWYDLTLLSNLGSDYNRATYQSVATLVVEDVE